MSKNATVKQLKIMVETNTGEEPFPLAFQKIYNPYKGSILSNANLSKYPYFTADILYPEDVLASKTYDEILYIFFDRKEFIRIIIKPQKSIIGGGNEMEKTDSMDIANRNVMTMLKLFFPTTIGSIENSFDKYLMKKLPDEKINIENVFSDFRSGLSGFIQNVKS